MEEKVPNWQIVDELEHRLKNGEWYSLDESLPVPTPTNRKLKGALNQLNDIEKAPKEVEEFSLRDIKEQVKNTLDEDFGSISKQFTDEDIDYLANMINNGASSSELSSMIKTKLSSGAWEVPQETINKVNELFELANLKDVNSKERV